MKINWKIIVTTLTKPDPKFPYFVFFLMTLICIVSLMAGDLDKALSAFVGMLVASVMMRVKYRED